MVYAFQQRHKFCYLKQTNKNIIAGHLVDAEQSLSMSLKANGNYDNMYVLHWRKISRKFNLKKTIFNSNSEKISRNAE